MTFVAADMSSPIKKLFDEFMQKVRAHQAVGKQEHPVLGTIEPAGFGWKSCFSDTSTLQIPVHVEFEFGSPDPTEVQDNYIHLRARFPQLLNEMYVGYRELRQRDDELYGREQVLHLRIPPIRVEIAPDTKWFILAVADPYDGEWEFKMRGWRVEETTGGVG